MVLAEGLGATEHTVLPHGPGALKMVCGRQADVLSVMIRKIKIVFAEWVLDPRRGKNEGWAVRVDALHVGHVLSDDWTVPKAHGPDERSRTRSGEYSGRGVVGPSHI